MPDDYIELDITTEETELADGAITQLQDKWDTWEPNDGDLEVILIETLASMVADAAQTASIVPRTIIETIGQELFGVARSGGTAAVGTLTITLKDAVGYTIYAGSEFAIDGYAFTVDADKSTVGVTSVQVNVTAAEVGTAYNGLTGVDVAPITAYTYVTGVSLNAPTSGGAEADSDETYLTNLLRELQLYGRTLVTARDYELASLRYSDVGWAKVFNNGGRAVAYFGLQPDGTVLSSARKTQLTTDFQANRLANVTFTLYDPAFGIVNITYAVKAYPDYDPADLISRINAHLTDVLQPLNWGRPKYIGDLSTQEWMADTTVRRAKIVDLIGDVEGVDYVYSVVLSGTNKAGGAALTVAGVPQKDRLTFSGTITSGSYKLQLDGQKIANALAYNANAQAIQDALVTLSNVEPGDVIVTGTYPTFDIVHSGAYFGRARVLAVTDLALVGGGTAAVSNITAASVGNGDLSLPLTNAMVGLPNPGVISGYVI